MTDTRTQHWLESSVSLWQLVGSMLALVLTAGTTWVIQDRANENRLTKLEVRQEFVIAQQKAQDTTIEFLRLTAESNRIALGEIKQRLDAIANELRKK